MWWLLACRAPDPTGHTPPPEDSSTTPEDTPTGSTPTGATGSTGVTGDTGPDGKVFDCATVPAEVVSVTPLEGPRGYHDVVFPDDGTLVGNSAGNQNLLKADIYGTSAVFVPGVGTIEQMVLLPTGDIAVASATYGIALVTPNGGSSVLNASIHPYGLVLGPDGKLWSADYQTVSRVDTVTGAAEVVVPNGALPRGSPRVIGFTIDDTKLVIGTMNGSQGRLYAVDLDASYDAIGSPYEFATDVGSGAYHDTMGVDLCGYLYVADYGSSALYRVSPDGGAVQQLLDSSGFLLADYIHGLDWGRGFGGWREDAIYGTHPYDANRVSEVVIGVPSREWTGGVAINLP